MAMARRLSAGGVLALLALALGSLTAEAATKRPVAVTVRPAAAPTAVRTTTLPPMVLEVNPLKVNPVMQPNIMILGQHLTPATTVLVGGHPATTVAALDAYHLLVKLPDNLAQGAYSIEVTNEGGTAMATDQLVIDGSGQGPSTLTILTCAGFGLLLLLIMRMARTPGLA